MHRWNRGGWKVETIDKNKKYAKQIILRQDRKKVLKKIWCVDIEKEENQILEISK